MLLEIKDITRYFGGLCALAGVTFGVESGKIHGLIGPNGAGKTTLINILSGLTKPSSGQLRLGDRQIETLPAHRVAALGVARTFQNIRLFPALTCLENVIAGQHLTARRPLIPRLLCLPSAQQQEKTYQDEALAILERVGLANRANFGAQHLSYGERRRLEIARALASGPRLLLLDEPVAGMRREEMLGVADLIRSLANEGMTILLIEHNMAFVMDLCACITVLSFGKVITTGSPKEVGEHPEVIEAYLGRSDAHA
ncbi:MAG: ABC transporter ATP-binding protein [Desulfobacula sp.]|jgi:ABC-type branched-subunit amino acid transport system ATPase component